MTALRLFEKRPDHPLAERGELERVLAALKTSQPADALQELQHWQGTLRDFDGFACDDRLALVKGLDEAARPLATKVFAEFCAHMHKRDRSQRKRAQLLEAFWTQTAGAYARCVADNEQGGKRAGEIRAELPVALARAYRNWFLAAKARAMMYLPAAPKDWLPLYRPFAFAEVAHFATEAIHVYPKEVHGTPRAELVKLVAFCLAAPHELPPEQIELMARVLDRFAISFGLRKTPDGYAIEAGPALPKLAELEKLSASNLLTEELRFGAEFAPTQMVTVLRHLLRYLVAKPPRRGAQRVAVAGRIEILHGFAPICQRVTAIEIGASNALKEDLDVAAAKAKGGLQMAAEEIEAVPESWEVADQSEWGLGCKIPPDGGAWAEPGVLCGIRARPQDPWSVAIIRRLDSGAAGAARCGLQILSKKPVSVWLRVLGREGQETSNWETSSGSFSYDYARTIVLPDAPKVEGRPMLLLAGGKFVPSQICELVMGDNSRHIKLADFLEQGADYIRASFAWMVPGKS